MISTTLARVKNTLESAKISVSAFAAIARRPQATIATAIYGRLYLGMEEEARLLTLSVKCKQIIEALAPLTFKRGEQDVLQFLVENRSVEEVHELVTQLFEEK